MQSNLSRFAPLTGLVFGGLVLAAIFGGGSSPDSDWSAQRVVAFYTSHSTGQKVSVYCLGFGALFALFFAATLRSHLRSRSQSDGLIALGFGGGIVFAVALAVAGGINSAAVEAPGKIDPVAEQAISVLSNDVAFVPLLVGLISFTLANGIAILHTGALPKWLGWLAIVIGIVAAIPPVGWFALFGVIIWVAITSIVMVLRSGEAPAEPATA